MSYNRENFKKVKEKFKTKRDTALALAEGKRMCLYREIPEVEKIDRELSMTGLQIFEAALNGGDVKARIEELEKENLALQKIRAELISEKGYPADITEPKFDCEKCKDTGFTDSVMCECFRRELVRAGIESSGLGSLIRRQTFDTFKTEYYKDDPRSLTNIEFILSQCRYFAEHVGDEDARSLLFIGGTGLGKTHLSTAIAGKAIENGTDVVYETAQNMIGDFEYERFERSRDNDDARKTERYFDCDLLIIDDLGTEVANQFTVSCLYNIINTRIVRGKKMIINTNLSKDELRRRYADRITSRLFGEFQPLLFIGTDIRAKKLME